MSLPNENGTTEVIKDCFASIGLNFPNDPDNKKLLGFPIATLVGQIRQASGNTWDAAVEAFAGLIQIRMMRRFKVVIDGFDESWFDNNKQEKVQKLVSNLTENAIEIGEI